MAFAPDPKKTEAPSMRIRPGVRHQERSPCEALVQLSLQAIVIGTDGVLGLEQLGKSEKWRSCNVWDCANGAGLLAMLLARKCAAAGGMPNEFHSAIFQAGGEILDLLMVMYA